MKIINNRNNIIFGKLNPGDMFMFPGGESIFMKTTETNICNCVELTNGYLFHMTDSDFVTVVNATLILE